MNILDYINCFVYSFYYTLFSAIIPYCLITLLMTRKHFFLVYFK